MSQKYKDLLGDVSGKHANHKKKLRQRVLLFPNVKITYHNVMKNLGFGKTIRSSYGSV